MSISKAASAALLVLYSLTGYGAPRGPSLGESADPETIRAWDQGVAPDGKALPLGSGSVASGAELFAAKCQGCHGLQGSGATAEELAGGKRGLRAQPPDKTVGIYWPYATTLFDFIRRAMPLDMPGSLSNNEVYALTAYVLHINNLIPSGGVLDAARLRALRMPNRDGFVPIDLFRNAESSWRH